MLKKFKKKTNPKVLAAIVLFFILLSGLGIFSAMKLLGQKQDDRSQASVASGVVKARLQKVGYCAVGASCVFNVYVNTNNSNLSELKLKLMVESGMEQVGALNFKTAQTNTGRVDGRRNAQEGIRFEDNLLNQLAFTLTTSREDASLKNAIVLDWKVKPGIDNGGSTDRRGNISFNTASRELLLGTVEFKINSISANRRGFTRGGSPTTITLGINKTDSVALMNGTNEDALSTPQSISFKINVPEGTICKNDSACSDNQYCFQRTVTGRNTGAITSTCKNR